MSGASNRNYTKDPNRRKTGLQIGDANSNQLGKQREPKSRCIGIERVDEQ